MPKITRNNFTKEDKVLLGVYFDANPYLTPSGKTVLEISFCINLFESIVIKDKLSLVTQEISEALNRSPKCIKTWFRNERKRKQDSVKSHIKIEKLDNDIKEQKFDGGKPNNIKGDTDNQLDSSINARETPSPNLEEYFQPINTKFTAFITPAHFLAFDVPCHDRNFVAYQADLAKFPFLF